MIEILDCESDKRGPKIMVIGVGGGGNNAVDRMIDSGVKGVDFASVNTDVDVLDNSKAGIKLQIGTKLLKGYGAGADPTLGEAAAEENAEDIRNMAEDQDMVIITCGMGGGTGTGAAPVIAQICHDMGILTMGVVTTPFSFENGPRMTVAKAGIEKLKSNVDTLLIIPNDKLLEITDKQVKLKDAFLLCDSVLKYTIESISNIVYYRGEINIDFNDLKTTLANKGIGHLGIGMVNEDDSILEAVKQAVNSPLLETSIDGAANLLVNTSGNIGLVALNEAINFIRELAGESVNLIWGNVTGDVFDEEKIVVTIIATGMPEEKEDKRKGVITEVTLIPPKLEIPKVSQPKATVEEKDIDVPPFLSEFAKKYGETSR